MSYCCWAVLKFSCSISSSVPQKWRNLKLRTVFCIFLLTSLLGKLRYRHTGDGVEGHCQVRRSPIRGLALSRTDQMREQGWAFPHQPHYRSDLNLQKKEKGKKREKRSKTTLAGKIQLLDPGTTFLFVSTEQQSEENSWNCLKIKKETKKKVLLSHSTLLTSRYFVSNCARRANVTCSVLALPLAARLIYIHTWKPGLQQGSPALSFLSLCPSRI